MNTSPVPRVLVVDDVLQIRQAFGRFLTVAGMASTFAADGVEGLAAARASLPDLVLCDLEMPRMDGVALCAALREAIAKSKFKDVDRFGKPQEGLILLQDHGDAVCYRNLKVRPLTGR